MSNQTKKSVFQVLSSVDVNDKIQNKGKLSYLPWAWAWGEIAKRYPSSSYDYYRDNEKSSKHYKLPAALIEGVGGFCYTTVTIEGKPLQMWLPITDNYNKPILKPNVFDVNTTLMRCLTKNIAMFGLGHYIYAGEDMPDVTNVSKPKLSKSELEATLKGTIENAREVLLSYDVSSEYKKIITKKFK